MNVVSRFSPVPFGTRFFLEARWNRTPYGEMAELMPRKGRILDLGSGHGLLSLALALQSAERQVLGMDHDERRVALASRAARGLQNLAFCTGDLSEPKWGEADQEEWSAGLDGIALIDSMHYFPFEKQEDILRRIAGRLKGSGVFLMREVNRGAGGLFVLNRLHEQTMLALGFTKAQELYFRSGTQWTELLQRHGFTVEVRDCSRFPFADLLFVCKPVLAPLSGKE